MLKHIVEVAIENLMEGLRTVLFLMVAFLVLCLLSEAPYWYRSFVKSLKRIWTK